MKYLIWLSSDCTNLEETIEAIHLSGETAGILLIQDGVFMVDKGCEEGKILLSQGIKIHASKKHIEERGLTSRLVDGVELVDYSQIVDLIMEKYDKVISI